MDFATIIGFIAGLGLIVAAIVGRVGVAGFLTSFIDLPSVAITLGGTFAATMVNYSFHELVSVFAIAKKVFTEKDENVIGIIDTIGRLTKKARTQGVLAIEQEIKELPNPFLRHGFSLVLANIDAETIRAELETEITFIQERHKLGQEIFLTMGTFAPAFGMLGTIMGLIMMLAKLEDQSAIAGGMAVALITTLYGALAANLIFLPISGKLKRKSEDEVLVKEIIIEGIISMKSGAIPSIIEAKLKAYLPPKKRERKVIEK
ncbi:MAG: MotA/TolQ/ExbB proton channel family protein [Candidatus Omnitrophota bacterium]|nr:motility protein A [Candidatus Omnitrophota bacterium]MBU2528825.1 MotA/TolQ/ExbB proton channel family protein [bacterium]MBU3930398.1 MotA/TolQ/ExbB proton channel family protein [bacterium]MBU4122799.1 MotA/TolQ/ExbB proton channel family protein [bacterium]